jgi:hypothetical protein
MPKYQIRRYNGEIFETDDLAFHVEQLVVQTRAMSNFDNEIKKISWSEGEGRIMLTPSGWIFRSISDPVGTLIPIS